MTSDAILGLVLLIQVAVVLYLVGSLIRHIYDERRTSGVRKIWANFGLSIALCMLFFTSWLAQGLAEWGTFVNDQRMHGQPAEVREFLVEFSQSTLENWQSEFLQLFSFVTLAAILIHRGSAESKDSDERMEQAIQRIEEKLGTK